MAKRGPGRVSQPGKSSRVGKYTDPVASGRITVTPESATKAHESSPRWFGFAILAAMIIGALVIMLNYFQALPGAASPWYLLVGLLFIMTGFAGATRYK
jgi:RsiW-degrading membrane proteinase PrsW (M82 family)